MVMVKLETNNQINKQNILICEIGVVSEPNVILCFKVQLTLFIEFRFCSLVNSFCEFGDFHINREKRLTIPQLFL